jgi:hypothetical protein
MQTKVIVKGDKKVTYALAKIKSGIIPIGVNSFYEIAQKMKNIVVSRMNALKSGKMYARGGFGEMVRWHQASAPGDYPASDTGEMQNSLQINKGLDWVEFGSDKDYASHLEWGRGPRIITPKISDFLYFRNHTGKLIRRKFTKHPGFEPRPWLQPTLKAVDAQGLIVDKVRHFIARVT